METATLRGGSRVGAVVSATVDGPVPALDWSYAVDELRRYADGAATPVCRAHVRLFWEPEIHARPVAIADCVLVLESGGTVVVAGAVGATMHATIDDLIECLRCRLGDIARRELDCSVTRRALSTEQRSRGPGSEPDALGAEGRVVEHDVVGPTGLHLADLEAADRSGPEVHARG